MVRERRFDPDCSLDNMGDTTNRPRRTGELPAISNPDSRDALERGICARLALCSHDELRVLDRVLCGVERGREVYGPLDLASETRDFSAEAADELRDTVFYLAAHEVAQDDRRRERLRCEAADELHATEPVEFGLRELAEFDAGWDEG